MNPLGLSVDIAALPSLSVSYIHNGALDPSGTFNRGERIKVRLSLPRIIGAISTSIAAYSESGEELCEASGLWVALDGEFDVYEFSLKELCDVGLYFYTPKIRCYDRMLYAYPNSGSALLSEKEPDFRFQLTISDFKYAEPSGIYGGAIYHIFVDRFARSGRVRPKEGAVLVKDWSAGVPEFPEYPGAYLKNNTFYGGDLWGVIEKLPYIASLGVSAIYLSPIFESPSNHKYDTADYLKVDAMFGSDKALRALVSAAHELGIGIILDGVFNHTGADSKYFNRYNRYDTIGAYQSVDSPYYPWYDFKSHPNDYTAWWGIEILPRINPGEKSCREYFAGKDGVIARYAAMGIAGFRLDVVDELGDDFVADIKYRLNEQNPSSVLYGEVWEDASNKIAYNKRKRYYQGAELDGVMNYPLRAGIIDYLCKKKTHSLLYSLTDIINNAPKRIRDAQMNLLGTHDTERILTVLGGQSSEGKSNAYLREAKMGSGERAVASMRLKMAYTILATLPGVPTIFYGDEAGLEGYGDPFNRMPYPWGKEDETIIARYREIGALRKANKAYANGDFRLLMLNGDMLAFERTNGREAFITVVNNTDSALSISFDNPAKPLLQEKSFSLDPYSAQVFKTKTNSNLFYNFAI